MPELSVRTYVATTSPVDQFGPMVAAEARRRNFPEAASRAFLGDGSAWIWGLHRRYFPSFVAIVDFLHASGPLRKWLDDRSGEVLDADALEHFARIIVAAEQALAASAAIDVVIDEAGGLPFR